MALTKVLVAALSAALVVCLDAARVPALAGGGPVRSLSIPATEPFEATGVTLQSGESALITATGTISYGSQNPACSGSAIPPDGCSAETICPVGGGCGALVGRLGDGPPFLVGDRKTVQGPGVLYLGINDVKGAFADNSGAFSVTITTMGTATPVPAPNGSIGKVTRVSGGRHAWVRGADGQLTPIQVGIELKLGQVIVTGDNTTVTIEFTIGGRAGINSNAQVAVVSERTVADAGTDVPRAIVRTFDIFGLTQTQAPASVEIQTNGGVIGIKG